MPAYPQQPGAYHYDYDFDTALKHLAEEACKSIDYLIVKYGLSGFLYKIAKSICMASDIPDFTMVPFAYFTDLVSKFGSLEPIDFNFLNDFSSQFSKDDHECIYPMFSKAHMHRKKALAGHRHFELVVSRKIYSEKVSIFNRHISHRDFYSLYGRWVKLMYVETICHCFHLGNFILPDDIEDNYYPIIRHFIDDFCDPGNALFLPCGLINDNIHDDTYDMLCNDDDLLPVFEFGLLSIGDMANYDKIFQAVLNDNKFTCPTKGMGQFWR